MRRGEPTDVKISKFQRRHIRFSYDGDCVSSKWVSLFVAPKTENELDDYMDDYPILITFGFYANKVPPGMEMLHKTVFKTVRKIIIRTYEMFEDKNKINMTTFADMMILAYCEVRAEKIKKRDNMPAFPKKPRKAAWHKF